ALAVTFDDGFRDNLTQAGPVIARHRLRPTIFLATGCIGSKQRLWFDEVALAFKTSCARSVAAPWGETLPFGDEAIRLRALEEAWRRLKTLNEPDFDTTFARLLEALQPYGPAGEADRGNGMLDWKDVEALRGLGFTVGAHTATHPILSRVSPVRARQEIE